MNRWRRFFHFYSVWLVSLIGYFGLLVFNDPDKLKIFGLTEFIGLSILGLWRWAWVLLQLVRARIYLHWTFPRWRTKANQVPTETWPTVCCLVPTYQEADWITERVFRALAEEAKTLPTPLVLLVTSGSDAENEAILAILEAVDPGLAHIRLIQQVQNGQGKRKAMAEGLRTLAQLGLPANTVVALMDGDSEITPGVLSQSVPFFQLFPKMGALTTDELPVVKGSYWFSEWFHLRMAQRHHQMASMALSRKVLCLTGRFSLFRAEAAFAPSFATLLENDTLQDWLWGRFKFLSGDDKSTWFWLLRRGYEMLYLPDVTVYSIETVSGAVWQRAYQNMRRWYGNMLRNSDRAIALGPKIIGWFAWYCLIDQRISFWTSLLTPGLLILSVLQGQWVVFGLIASWVCFSRPLVMMIIFWQRRSTLKLIHALILPVSQWSGAFVKIWTQMNLAQQKWSNRGNQSISAAGSGWRKVSKISTARFLYGCQLFAFVLVLAWMGGLIHPLDSLDGILWHWQLAQQP
jgi:mannuronan synthase